MRYPKQNRFCLRLNRFAIGLIHALLLFLFMTSGFSCTNSETVSGCSPIFGGAEQDKLLARAEKMIEQEKYDDALALLRRIQNEFTLNEEQSAKWSELLNRVADARVSAQKSIEQKLKAESRQGTSQNTYRKRFQKKIPEIQKVQEQHTSKILGDQ